jgi:hypothetical protein
MHIHQTLSATMVARVGTRARSHDGGAHTRHSDPVTFGHHVLLARARLSRGLAHVSSARARTWCTPPTDVWSLRVPHSCGPLAHAATMVAHACRRAAAGWSTARLPREPPRCSHRATISQSVTWRLSQRAAPLALDTGREPQPRWWRSSCGVARQIRILPQYAVAPRGRGGSVGVCRNSGLAALLGAGVGRSHDGGAARPQPRWWRDPVKECFVQGESPSATSSS